MAFGIDAHPAAVRRDHVFFAGMSVLAAVVVAVGFAPTYYLRSQFHASPLPILLHVHGALFTSWMAFLILQTMLVATGRVAWHRVAGTAGAVLAAVMTTAGTAAGIATARRESAFDADAARAFLTIPLFSMLVFAALVCAGIVYRSRPHTHKRLMLLATISILDAPIARWPGAPGAAGVALLVDLLVAGAIAYDLVTRRRVHHAYLWGGAAIVINQALRNIVGRTDAWHALSRWLIG